MEDLWTLNGLMKGGKITPYIEKTSFCQEIPKATGYLEKKRTKGKDDDGVEVI